MRTLYEIWTDYNKDPSCAKTNKELTRKMEKLCDYILAKYNVFKGEEGYEDLHQEGWILLLDLMTRYDEEVGSLENYFLAAFRKVVYQWRVKNCIDANIKDVVDLTEDVFANVLANDFDNRLQECLSLEENHVYCDFLKKGITDPCIIAKVLSFEELDYKEMEREIRDIIVRIRRKAIEIYKE